MAAFLLFCFLLASDNANAYIGGDTISLQFECDCRSNVRPPALLIPFLAWVNIPLPATVRHWGGGGHLHSSVLRQFFSNATNTNFLYLCELFLFLFFFFKRASHWETFSFSLNNFLFTFVYKELHAIYLYESFLLMIFSFECKMFNLNLRFT